MDISDAKDFINLVTAEYKRRSDLLPEDDDGTGLAYDQWMFTDLPFLHDLCILYLIAIRHHVERRLLYLAARATGHTNQITHAEFKIAQESLRKLPLNKRWAEIVKRLDPETRVHYPSIKVLQGLANSYKHDPNLEPDPELIALLGLDTTLNYMPMPESFELKKGLALFVGMPEKSTFADITQRYVEHASAFLKEVEAKAVLSPVKGRRLNFITDIGH